MTILVTGATGHLGNVLVRNLVARGERVRALILRGESLLPLEGLPVEMVPGDVLDEDILRFAMQGVDQVYHLASLIAIRPGMDEKVWRVNVEGTQNVIRAAFASGVKRLIYASSIHALKRPRETKIVDERLPFDGENSAGIYDRSKATASLLVQRAIREGLDGVIVCPTGIIGPYDFLGSEMGGLVRQAMTQRLIFAVEGGFDFVDVRDVAQGLIQAAEKGKRGEVYLLSGTWIEIGALLVKVGELSGHSLKVLTLPRDLAMRIANIVLRFARWFNTRPRFTPYAIETVSDSFRVSSDKAREHLGYQTRSIEETLRDTVAWWRLCQKRPTQWSFLLGRGLMEAPNFR
ncbi:MAG: SDR family oxidoreductase [Thermanaerothrix sp.]|nr:SDR family oxidoreductase [Thermanaerothrix sp.]